MRSAVAEGKALQGCNLSAVDGPKLAGACACLLLAPPLPVFLSLPRHVSIGSIRRPYFAGNLSSPVPVAVRSGFCVAGGMHKGGLSGAVSIPSCGGSWPLLPAWGDTLPPRRPPGGGNEKGGESNAMLPQADSSCPLPVPNKSDKKTTRRRRSVFSVGYPPPKVQFLLSSDSGCFSALNISRLGG